MIGIFAGTATATPSGKANAGASQSAADGFGATLLEAVTAAVPGSSAETADATAPAPTADEIFAALTTGFAGAETAPVTEGTPVEAGVVPTDADADADAETDATAAAPADASSPADTLPTATVAASPAAALPVAPVVVPPVAVQAPVVTAPAAGGEGPADTVIAAASAAPAATAAPVVAAAAAIATPRATVAGTPAEDAPTTAASTTDRGTRAAVAEPAAVAATPVAPATSPAAPAAQAPVAAPAASALPAATTETAPSAVPAAESPAVDLVALPKDAPVAAPVVFAPAASTTAPVTGAAASAPLPAQPVPLATQVAGPIFTLAAAGNGEHVMTVDITPDNLGPITVRAHVGADGVRVELFAPSDIARDALRAILPDIRKDMGGAGLGSNLDLSSQNQPTDRGDGGNQQRRQPQGDTLASLDQQTNAARPWLLTDPSTTIDVMA